MSLSAVARYTQGTVVEHIQTGLFGHVVGFYREHESAPLRLNILWEDTVMRPEDFKNVRTKA